MTQPGPTPAAQHSDPESPPADVAPGTDRRAAELSEAMAGPVAELEADVVTGADGATAESAEKSGEQSGDEAEKPSQTLLEQMGGLSGLVYSTVPVLVFVAVFLPTRALAAAIWASVGSAVVILIVRLIRREPVQPAISGVVGVAVAAFIAYRTGSARGYFLFGIWTSLVYGAAFLVSVVARWPLAGVVWATLNGTGMAWRSDKACRRYYDVATAVWVLVFGARFVVQEWLYQTNQVGWLGVARIGMGWPLTAIAALVTIWAVREADQRQKALAGENPENPENSENSETPAVPET